MLISSQVKSIVMGEKYIRKNRSSFSIVKSSRTYARVSDLDDAVFIRDLLIRHDWNMEEFPQVGERNGNYLVFAIADGKLHLAGKHETLPDDITIKKQINEFKRNPNGSRYGLNITRVFDVFAIKKQIAGDDYIFGYYDSLEDARFVRNFLMDNSWNVNEFREIEFDEEAGDYKVTAVIDDMVYVIDSAASRDEIDLERSYEKFLSEISKHRHGLAHRPHLDPLKDRIPDLEERFQVKARDENWSFDGIGNEKEVLNQIIFKLTPFQKSVYDAIGKDSSLEEIEKALIRYRSRNFTKKILKNIDELAELNLITKTGDNAYSKTNL